MANWPLPVSLEGARARLEPLALEHLDGLRDAAADGDAYRLPYTNAPSPAEMDAEIQRRLGLAAAGAMLPFSVIDRRTGEIAGMTTYMNVDAANRRLEIGSTWYGARFRRTGLNTDAKLLLLAHAFEQLGCIAVEFRTSSLNLTSRRAIERLGASLDGILRSHAHHRDGSLRDTCVYSITAAEWPSVKAHVLSLQRRAGTGRAGPNSR